MSSSSWGPRSCFSDLADPDLLPGCSLRVPYMMGVLFSGVSWEGFSWFGSASSTPETVWGFSTCSSLGSSPAWFSFVSDMCSSVLKRRNVYLDASDVLSFSSLTRFQLGVLLCDCERGYFIIMWQNTTIKRSAVIQNRHKAPGCRLLHPVYRRFGERLLTCLEVD